MAIGTVVFYPNYIHNSGYDAAAEPSIVTQNYASSGGETTGAAYDLVDNRRDARITIDTSGETDNFNVDFDLTANITAANFVIVDNHNFQTASAEITVGYGGSAQTIASGYAGTLNNALALLTLSTNVLRKPITDGILLINFSGTRTAQNFEVYSTYESDVGIEYTADVLMGEIGIGASFTPSVAPDINLIETQHFDGVEVRRSAGGQNTSFKRYGERKAWALTWSYVSNTDKEGFQKVFQITEGGRYPFWIDLGESATPHLYYVRFLQNALSVRKLTANAYEVTILIESEV